MKDYQHHLESYANMNNASMGCDSNMNLVDRVLMDRYNL